MKSRKGHGTIRLIAGQWRGRKLPVRHAEGLRPTTDRIKETLFNWLSGEIRGARCLDLFAGSGSLGFEALSRGAGQVTMLELDRANAAQLKQNLALLQASAGSVECVDAAQWLGRRQPLETADRFDIVFIDPPFRRQMAEQCCQLLSENDWLAGDALIYLETERELADLTLPNSWQLLKEKHAGQVTYRLFLFQQEQKETLL